MTRELDLEELREDCRLWYRVARTDSRGRYPTKGAVQESLGRAVFAIDQLTARLHAAESAVARVEELAHTWLDNGLVLAGEYREAARHIQAALAAQPSPAHSPTGQKEAE